MAFNKGDLVVANLRGSVDAYKSTYHFGRVEDDDGRTVQVLLLKPAYPGDSRRWYVYSDRVRLAKDLTELECVMYDLPYPIQHSETSFDKILRLLRGLYPLLRMVFDSYR